MASAAIVWEEANTKVSQCLQNPKLLITYLWFSTILFAILYSLAAITFAANNDGSDLADNKSLGFASIWMMLLMIALSVGGTLVMRRFQTPLAVGFFIGVVTMMSFQMFAMMVLFAGSATLARSTNPQGSVHSDEAAAAFSFFMFFLYSTFTIVLIKYRHIVIKDAKSTTNTSNTSALDNQKTLENVQPSPLGAPPVSV